MKKPPSPSDSAATSARKLPAKDKSSSPIDGIIHTVRGERVIFDADLAKIYGVQTKVLNQAVKRNRDKFPPDFLLELTQQKYFALNRSQIVTGSSKHRDLRSRPYALTEHGALMAATILNTPQAGHEVRQHGEGVVERSGTARCFSCG